MSDNLRRLRDAVIQRGRTVEVSPEGEVREVDNQEDKKDPKEKKATKLAERTFGATAVEPADSPLEREVHAALGAVRSCRFVRFFLPSVDRLGYAIDTARALAIVRKHLWRVTNGLTVFRADGSWKGGGGVDVREPVLVVEAYLEPTATAPRPALLLAALLVQLQVVARQDAWLVVIDGTPYFLAA